jgi:hypothetical protein
MIKQQPLANLVLLLVALVIAALVCEIGLRTVLGAPPRWKFPQESYVAEQSVGYWLRPNQDAFTLDKPVHVNSLGLRDHEYPSEVPLGTRRTVALGDSQTFGNGLELKDTWPKQLERTLNNCNPETPWEVVNAGLPGSNTAHQEMALNHLLKSLRFDSVVLGFYVNDLSGGLGPPFPLDSHSTWSMRIIYALKRSAVLMTLWQGRTLVPNLIHPSADLLYEQHVLTGEPDAAVEAGWARVERSLTAMKARLDERNAQFVILVIPRRDQVSGAQVSEAYNYRIARIAKRHGIGLVDPLRELRQEYVRRGDHLFVSWDGHNGAYANAAIAATLTRRLLGPARC